MEGFGPVYKGQLTGIPVSIMHIKPENAGPLKVSILPVLPVQQGGVFVGLWGISVLLCLRVTCVLPA
jgi:hypothetical protein